MQLTRVRLPTFASLTCKNHESVYSTRSYKSLSIWIQWKVNVFGKDAGTYSQKLQNIETHHQPPDIFTNIPLNSTLPLKVLADSIVR